MHDYTRGDDPIYNGFREKWQEPPEEQKTPDESDEILKLAISTYGAEPQIIMVMEEMSELQKELCKSLRGKDTRKAIAEEIADVQIMLEQMLILFDCKELCEDEKAFKLRRLAERIEADLRHEALKEVWENCQKLRRDHIRTVTNREAINLTKFIMKHLLMNNLGYMSKADLDEMSSFIGVGSTELKEEISGNPYKGNIEFIALVNAYLTIDPTRVSPWQLPFTRDAIYRWDESSLNTYSRLQEFMNATGYEASDDEVKLFNGTHELYMTNPVEEEGK